MTAMQTHILKYGAYNSTLAEGKRVRRMLRTELSLEKIATISQNHPLTSHTYHPRVRSSERTFNKRTQPKLESLRNSYRPRQNMRKVIEIRYEYYETEARKEAVPISLKSIPFAKTPRESSSRKSEIKSKSSSQRAQSSLLNSTNQKNSKNNKNASSLVSGSGGKSRQISSSYQSSSRRELRFEHNQYELSSGLVKSDCKAANKINSKHREGDNQIRFESNVLQSKINEPMDFALGQESKIEHSRMDHISGRSSVRSTIRTKDFRVLEDISVPESHKVESINPQLKNSVGKNSLRDSRGGLSLKLDSIRNDLQNMTGGDTSRSRDRRGSFKNLLPLTSREPSERRSLVGTGFEQPCANNIEDVYERIEIYNYLLGLFSEYCEITMNYYEEGERENYEVLCFLLQKKYFTEKVKMLKSLTNKKARNIFTLVPTQIPTEILHEHLSHEKIRELIRELQDYRISAKKRMDKSGKQLQEKHPKEAEVLVADGEQELCSEIIGKLKEEMEKVYQEWQEESDEQNQERCENRMIETMELIFFMSELAGRKVKKLEFAEEISDFEEYYERYLPRLMETYLFFSNKPDRDFN